MYAPMHETTKCIDFSALKKKQCNYIYIQIINVRYNRINNIFFKILIVK